MKKKLMATLLALALVLSLAPMVFAAEGDGSSSGSDSSSTEQPSESPSTSPDPSESPSTSPDPSESPSTSPDPSESPSTSPEPDESEDPNGCTGEANCPADEHTENACKSQCTMGAGCPNTAGHHKTNCVAACTRTSSCPNTSGDATVHLTVYVVTKDSATLGTYNSLAEAKAAIQADQDNSASSPTPSTAAAAEGEDEGNESPAPAEPVYVITAQACPKANVANSVVLTVGGGETPAESEKPDESEKPTEITKAEDFSDVNADDWFAAELTTVIEKGWVKGNEDGSFDPNGDVSGEQAVVFISRMLNKGFNTEGANWADEATAWADKDGLTEGIEITSEGIARKDLILLLWRAAGKPASEKEVTFTDLDGVEGDHLTALKWAVENNIILGNDDGTFTPDSTTSRSQIAAILVRCDKAVNK